MTLIVSEFFSAALDVFFASHFHWEDDQITNMHQGRFSPSG